ncbi:MAG: pimeloyl-ACP methyl ester carboxylesterase [Crocinitomix sp.]|jgi:pimeloyl-ACP methyl ester carboxylesterase
MKIIKYIQSIIILLVGSITIFLEEPLFGIGLIIISLLLMPFSSNLLTKKAPRLFTKRNKILISLTTGLIIVIAIGSFGRKDYNRVEKITNEELANLSIHPIKKTIVNNLDYYYIEKGEGETILLLHGFPDMANTWDETISELSKTHRVIAPFLRGYYPTGIPSDNDFSVKTIAGDIVKLVDNLSIDKFTLVGQDWGAAIGFSVTNLIDERVQKFVSIAIPHTACLELTPELAYAGRHFFLLGSGDYGARYTRKSNFEYIDRLYQRWSPDFKNFQASSDAIKETFKFPNRTEAAIGYYSSFSTDQNLPEVQEFYQKIPETPILFLLGEHDLIYTENIVSSMKEKMPKGSKTVVFKNAGHFLHREVFPEFISELKAFLKSNN